MLLDVQVKKTDTFASVSLQYGITVSPRVRVAFINLLPLSSLPRLAKVPFALTCILAPTAAEPSRLEPPVAL